MGGKKRGLRILSLVTGAGIGCWLLDFLDRGQVCFYCGCAAVNTNLGQSSLESGLACWGWRQYILEVQVAQQLGVLVGQLGAQGLDLNLDLGIFFQAALEEQVGQLQLCLHMGVGVKYPQSS